MCENVESMHDMYERCARCLIMAMKHEHAAHNAHFLTHPPCTTYNIQQAHINTNSVTSLKIITQPIGQQLTTKLLMFFILSKMFFSSLSGGR